MTVDRYFILCCWLFTKKSIGLKLVFCQNFENSGWHEVKKNYEVKFDSHKVRLNMGKLRTLEF